MCLGNPKSKFEQLKAIEHGRGIQHILDESYRIFNNPMLIFDMDYNLIAFSCAATVDDPIWNEFMVHGRLRDATIEFFKDEGFIDNVANSTIYDGVTYLISDKLKHNRIFGQLYNRNHIPVADLVAVEYETPFEEDTPGLIKTICDVLSKELGKSAYYQDYGQSYEESIVRKLIEDSIENKEIYTGHVANIDYGLKTNIFVAVVDIALCDPEYTKLVYFRDLIKQTNPSFKCYIYSNRIVLIISTDKAALNEKKELRSLKGLLERENIYAGISGRFENLFKMSVHYNEAVDALNHGLKSDCAARIFLHGTTNNAPSENI